MGLFASSGIWDVFVFPFGLFVDCGFDVGAVCWVSVNLMMDCLFDGEYDPSIRGKYTELIHKKLLKAYDYQQLSNIPNPRFLGVQQGRTQY